MFNYLNKIASTAILLSAGLYSAAALSETYVVTDFRFGMNDPSFDTWESSSTAPTAVGSSPWGTIVEGVYQGDNTTNDIVDFTFFTIPVHVYTAATNIGSSNSPPAPQTGEITGGPAITIDQNALTADMSSWIAEWNGTEFLQGNNNEHQACFDAGNPLAPELSAIARVTNNLDNTFIINWNSCITGQPFDGAIGFWRLELTCTSCPEVALDDPDTLTATQATLTTRTISNLASEGNVVITSAYGVSPANTTFTWTVSDASIVDIDGNTTDGSFTFNPSGLAVDTYTISHTYIDTTLFPPHTAPGSIQLTVVADAVLNHIDTDGDGIPDLSDDVSLTNQEIQSEYANASTYVLKTDVGTIKVGNTALCAGSGARITSENIIAFSGSSCSAVTNGVDTRMEGRVGIGGYFDFEVNSLATAGDVANVVIPLTAAIPEYAVYRKYTAAGGWTNFDVISAAAVAAGDALASAPSISNGVCPAANSTAYTPRLTTGDECLRITIKDGGPNDADGSANKTIQDPGGIAQIQSGVNAKLPGGCSITGKTSSLSNNSEWLLLASFIVWLGFISYRNKKQAE